MHFTEKAKNFVNSFQEDDCGDMSDEKKCPGVNNIKLFMSYMIVKNELDCLLSFPTWGQCYKTFSIRKLRIFVIS